MPMPHAILGMGPSAYRCGRFPLQFLNPHPTPGGRSQPTRTFHAYLELTMQAKHDPLIGPYCQTIGVVARRSAGTRIDHARGVTAQAALTGFYVTRARTASNVIKDQMASRRRQGPPQGQRVFTPGVRVDAGGQNIPRIDGYCYETSYWHDAQDIYVLFHCYPPR